ncbi:hypothetical protein LTR85_007846 [Meristemomyces frigidus]|nr:hypothetical protein LTR85_007846 [Meristemomyces frigidus]
MTAVNRFFGTTELVEAVLDLLPPRDLLLSQRVSCKFRDVVTDMRKLQMSLFLAKPDVTPYNAPLCLPDLNPLINYILDPPSTVSGMRQLRATEATLRPEASWRKMYFSSPPARGIHFGRAYTAPGIDRIVTKRLAEARVVRRAGGVKLGDLIENLVAEAGPRLGVREGRYYICINHWVRTVR